MTTRADFLFQTPFTLSLSSGFFGYFAHLGFVDALEEKGLKPHKLSGSSAGALVAAGLASGRTAKELAEIFLKIQKKDFWDPKFGFGYLQGQKIEELLSHYCVRAFSETLIPLHISVFNIRRLRTQVLSEGLIAKACRASASVPLLFHPVKIESDYFWDGGVRDRSAHRSFGSSEMPAVVHYLDSQSIISRIEDYLFYRDLLATPFCFKTPSPHRMGPSALEKGTEVIEHFRTQTRTWLEEKVQV